MGIALRAPRQDPRGKSRGRGGCGTQLLSSSWEQGKELGGSARRVRVRVRCVWRGRDVDEERALFLSLGAQLILLPGAAQRQSQRWIRSEGDAHPGGAAQGRRERQLKRAERGKNQIYAWNWASFSPMQKGICSTFLPSSAPVS